MLDYLDLQDAKAAARVRFQQHRERWMKEFYRPMAQIQNGQELVNQAARVDPRAAQEIKNVLRGKSYA